MEFGAVMVRKRGLRYSGCNGGEGIAGGLGRETVIGHGSEIWIYRRILNLGEDAPLGDV